MSETETPTEAKPRREKDKSDLVNDAMRTLRIPSYEAWDLTVEELDDKLKET